MKRYRVVVTIEAEDQGAAFAFVEKAIDERLEKGGFRAQRIAERAGSINVATEDGGKSVVF